MRPRNHLVTYNPVIPLAHQPAAAAKRLGIGKTTLYRLIAANKIRITKVGRRTLVPESELVRYTQAQK